MNTVMYEKIMLDMYLSVFRIQFLETCIKSVRTDGANFKEISIGSIPESVCYF